MFDRFFRTISEALRAQSSPAEPKPAAMKQVRHKAAPGVPAPSKRKGPPGFFADLRRREAACKLFLLGMSLRQVAVRLGCSHATLIRALRADAAFRDEVRVSRSDAAFFSLWCRHRWGSDSWRGAAWLLERLRPEIHGKNTRPTLQQVAEFFEEHREIVLRGLPPDTVAELRPKLKQLANDLAARMPSLRNVASHLVPPDFGLEEDDNGRPAP